MFSFNNTEINSSYENRYLLVQIAENLYAFDINSVKEVLPMIEIFSPENSSNMIGVINLRGESVPVADFLKPLNINTLPVTSEQKLVILDFDSNKISIIVDKIIDIIALENVAQVPLQAMGDFLYSAVYDKKPIALVNTLAFFKFFAASINNVSITTNELVTTDKASLPMIKTRTEIINKKNGYLLADDAFLNEKFIIFKLNSEVYAFNILYIEEISKVKKNNVSHIPCVPEFIRGIINSDGDYLCLMDIKPFLNMEITPLDEKNDVLIVNVNEMRFAVLVDGIIDIDRLSLAQTSQSELYAESFIQGETTYNDSIVNLLDVNKLFSAKNMDIERYETEQGE